MRPNLSVERCPLGVQERKCCRRLTVRACGRRHRYGPTSDFGPLLASPAWTISNGGELDRRVNAAVLCEALAEAIAHLGAKPPPAHAQRHAYPRAGAIYPLPAGRTTARAPPRVDDPRPASCRTVQWNFVWRKRAAEWRSRSRQDHGPGCRRSASGPPHRLAVGYLRADVVANASRPLSRLARSYAARVGRCGARRTPCSLGALWCSRDAARSGATHRLGGRRCAVGG